MNRIESEIDKSEIDKVLTGKRKLEKLLRLEKERRKVDKAKLVFIGMANIANYYWCAMKALLNNKKEELLFFRAYLHDRILYSSQLGLIDKLPEKEERLLQIGEEITYKDVEKLLKEKEMKRKEILEQGECPPIYLGSTVIDKNGNRAMLINPDLPSWLRELEEERAKSEGFRIADLEEFPIERGVILETTKSEEYPTIRWNFEWNGYVVVGVPDGITDSFVYEFKTTRNKFLAYVKPVAFAQADLYGHFFRRDKKRVQIYVVKEGVTKTWEEETDVKHALETLYRFKAVDEGAMPIAPRKWKCKSCDFKEKCELWKSRVSPSSSDNI